MNPTRDRVLVFDVNETLLDLGALDPQFARVFGDPAVRREWFATMLQSALLLTVTGPYFDFGSHFRAALTLTAERRGVTVSEADEKAILGEVRWLPAPRGALMLLALFVVSSCTTSPLETRATERPRYTVIPTATSAARTPGTAPIARIEGSSSSDVDSVALDGGALTFVFSGIDHHLHIGRVFPQGDLQDQRLELAAQHSPWGLGLAVGRDGSRWIGLYQSVVRLRPDRTLEELPIPASRPPGLAAEGGRNGEVTTIAVDDAALYIGRAGIPALTRLDLASGRTVALALPDDMPDVARIARGPGGDLFFAANQHSSPTATESTAHFRRANGQVEALPYRGRRLVANS